MCKLGPRNILIYLKYFENRENLLYFRKYSKLVEFNNRFSTLKLKLTSKLVISL